MTDLEQLNLAAEYFEKNYPYLLDDSEHGLRGLITVAMATSVVENVKSIPLLIEHERYSTVSVLYRPTFETVVRMLWLSRCATEKEVDRFYRKEQLPKKGTRPITLKMMIVELENQKVTSGGLIDIYNSVSRVMNSFVHGGSAAINTRISGGRMIQPWDPFYQRGTCQFGAILIHYAFYEIIHISEKNTIQKHKDDYDRILCPILPGDFHG